jgi:putative flippase GtrA
LNDQWTWRENQSSRHFSFAHRLARYYLSAALGALINYASLITLTHFAGMNFLVSNLIGIFGGMFFNFILSEMWVFKDSASE